MELTRIATCLRPYGLNNKQLHKIYFFDTNGIIFSTRSGWIEKSNIKDFSKYYSSVDVTLINIKEPARKIKKDLKVKQNFYIKAEKVNDWESMQFLKDEYDLYVYVDGVNVKIEKTNELIQDENNTTCINTVKYTEFVVIGLTDESFTIVKSEILAKKDTSEKIQAQKILEVIKEKKLYVNLSEYDVCKLLTAFNITEK